MGSIRVATNESRMCALKGSILLLLTELLFNNHLRNFDTLNRHEVHQIHWSFGRLDHLCGIATCAWCVLNVCKLGESANQD